MGEKKLMKPHESPRIRKISIRGDSGDSWPVWNRGNSGIGIIPSGTVVVFVVIRGRSCAYVANRVITDTRFWYKKQRHHC